MMAGSASAQPKSIVSNFQYDNVAPPVSLTWQLATPSGEYVDLSITGIEPAAGSQRAYIITPENAAQFGVDFPAWSVAVNDPTFSRSIMTWAGVTQEQSVVRNFPLIELDDIRIFVDNYQWPIIAPGLPAVDIRAFAFDFPIVPEPATCLLALISVTWLSIRRYSRSRRCRCRCQRAGL
jgi:hypothetical protein